jgi:hypothetical protein
MDLRSGVHGSKWKPAASCIVEGSGLDDQEMSMSAFE